MPVAPGRGGWALLVVCTLSGSWRPRAPLFHCVLPPTAHGASLAVGSTEHRLPHEEASPEVWGQGVGRGGVSPGSPRPGASALAYPSAPPPPRPPALKASSRGDSDLALETRLGFLSPLPAPAAQRHCIFTAAGVMSRF